MYLYILADAQQSKKIVANSAWATIFKNIKAIVSCKISINILFEAWLWELVNHVSF